MSPPGRLVVAGKLVVDEVLTCLEPPLPGSSQRASARAVSGGGQVWHTALAARQVAADVVVTGWCGQDAETDGLRAALTSRGVADHLVAAGEAVRAVVLVGPDGERTIVSTGGSARLAADALDTEAVLDGAGWLHLDGFCLDARSGDALVALAGAAYDVGVPVSLEPASLASLATTARCLERLPPLEALVGRPDENNAAVGLLAAPPRSLVAHDGPRPVRTRTADGEVVETRVPPSPVVTTGAGDRFAGGWLAARLRGEGPAEAAVAGIAAALAAARTSVETSAQT